MHHTTEQVTSVSVQTEEVLRLTGRTAEQVDARGCANAVGGVPKVNRVMSSDPGRKYRYEQQESKEQES